MTTHDFDYDPDFDAEGFAVEHRHSFLLRGVRYYCQVLTMSERDTVLKEWSGKETDLYRSFLEPESFERFMAVADDKSAPLPATVSQAIVNDLIEVLVRGNSLGDSPKPESSSVTPLRGRRKRTTDSPA